MAPMEENGKLKVVTEEVVICKLLTSNDLKVRKRGLSSLKKWFKKIATKKGLQEDDFNRIWSGLFYYFWMSDKPLVQEEAAEFISGMVHILDNFEAAMFYVRGFFSSIVKQWDRISHYRIDKFLMFVRRFLRQILISLKNHEWNIEKLELFSAELYNAIQVLPYSLALHLNEIFNEEVAKISEGEIPTDALVALYKGFLECIVNLRPSMLVVNSIQTNIFGGLARQLKLYIKQKALNEDGDNERNDENAVSGGCEKVITSALDPRPGGVDVFLPFVEFDEKTFVRFLKEYASKQIPIKARNILTQLISMFASITKLRTSVSDTDKLIREMQGSAKNRKRPKQTLSKLIKKSCRKLEEEDDESEAENDERILKKLRSLTDLIQIPAGKSTFTVVQAKTKSTEPKRTSISNEWTVTEIVDKPSSPKKAKISGSKNDWVVEETILKVDKKSVDEANNKSIEPLSASFSEKPAPAVPCNEEFGEREGQHCDTESGIVVPPENNEKLGLTLKGCEKSAHETDNKSIEQLSASFSEKPIVSFNEEDGEREGKHYDTESENVISASIVEVHPKLTKGNIDYVVADFHSKSENYKKLGLNLKDSQKSTDETNNEPKKPLSVSFSDKLDVSYYEENGERDGQGCDTESEIVVPASVVKARPKLMKEKKNYVVVDFQSQPEENKELSQKPERVLNEPFVESETITRILRSRKIESTPVSFSPDSKKSKKPREKKSEFSSQSQSQRKSTRIAEKQKRVLFKLEENTYQDIPTYEKALKSKPASPFDRSKLPAIGILKPYPVTSPINPFYFANGERKMNRKRRKN